MRLTAGAKLGLAVIFGGPVLLLAALVIDWPESAPPAPEPGPRYFTFSPNESWAHVLPEENTQ